ncbi:hypothetical protein D9Q98_001972 [Chlorella vulgaris]|uniref:EF-hand domain-containing protein n=1 Tax=Chlorella vulgaris TaxID=3077 RepID=A0A9D4YZU0_CHLVU|nr:hypothetical protein D9Q98_001972 [Chlorella vulgaris]
MKGSTALALLGTLLLVAEQASAIRLFDTRHPLKRQVGRLRRRGDGKIRQKEVDVEHVGRAVFDPSYAHEEDLTHEDMGLQDLHQPTDHVIEHRLVELFPSIDADHDGIITSEEMQRHLFLNGIAVSRRRAEAEFSDTDANADGKVTATEYLNTLLEEADEETRRKKAGVDLGTFPDPLDFSSYIDVTRAGFAYADRNHDGALDPEEFFDFLNPEEGHNSDLKLHRLNQDVFEHLADHRDRGAESPKPGLPKLELTFEQFYNSMWSQFTVWDTAPDASNWTELKERQNALRKFVLLDVNADNVLTPEELLPAFADLHPTENRYARMQAEHMMDMAECKDDRLTLEDMLKVPHAFYGVVHDEGDHSEL